VRVRTQTGPKDRQAADRKEQPEIGPCPSNLQE